MARIIEDVDQWVEYVPDVDDNRIDPDPMTVEICPMTTGEIKRMGRQYGAQLSNKKKSIERAQKLTAAIISERVRNVKNYSFRGTVIETGEQLVETETELIDDVFEAITKISKLQDGLKKKLNSSSGGSTAATSRHGEIVGRVSGTGSRNPGIAEGLESSMSASNSTQD